MPAFTQAGICVDGRFPVRPENDGARIRRRAPRTWSCVQSTCLLLQQRWTEWCESSLVGRDICLVVTAQWYNHLPVITYCLMSSCWVFNGFLFLYVFYSSHANIAKRSIWDQCNIEDRPTIDRFSFLEEPSWKNIRWPYYLHNGAR